MAELGVSDVQFVEACQRAEQNPIHKKIVDQIMAVDSFLAFKKLMVKRNQELNRQAMELFKKQSEAASTPAEPTATGAPTTAGAPAKEGTPATDEETKKAQDELREVMKVAHSLERAEEEEMMKRALEESEKYKSEEQKASEEEERMINEAIAASMQEENEHNAKLGAENQLTSQIQNASAAE